jgi:putative membrane protein
MRQFRDLIPRLGSAAAVAVISVIAACSRSTTTTATMLPMPATTGSAAGTLSQSVTVPALPQSDIDFLRRMSDANILEHTASGDSLEIAMAQAAVRRTQHAGVASFARTMIADHTMSLQHGQAIAAQTNIGMTMATGDTSAMPMFAKLDSLNGIVSAADFDRRYLQSQVAMHQHMLAELQTLRTVAHDTAVRQHIDMMIPVVEQHLVRAQALAQQVGTH